VQPISPHVQDGHSSPAITPSSPRVISPQCVQLTTHEGQLVGGQPGAGNHVRGRGVGGVGGREGCLDDKGRQEVGCQPPDAPTP